MNSIIRFSITCLLIATGTFETSAQNLFSTQLLTLDEKFFSSSEWEKNKLTVVVILLADCPACQSYSLTLNKLSSEFADRGVKFYGVFPGNYGSVAEDIEFSDIYKIRFPLLRDPNKNLVAVLHAKVAPEVFVFTSTGKSIYRGRIDDWMYAVGKKRIRIESQDLKNALTQWTSGKAISRPSTTPIGCIIE